MSKYWAHHDSFPKQLTDLLPGDAPSGLFFTGLTPEQTIQGYDYFGNGVPPGKFPGKFATSGGEIWVPSHPVKSYDLPTTAILRTSEPLCDGRRVIVTLVGSIVFQPAH